MRKSGISALGALLFSACVCAAPLEPVGPPDHWLDWTNNYADVRDEFARCGVTPVQAAEWERMLQRMARRVTLAKVDLPSGWYGALDGRYYGTWLSALAPCKGLPMEGGLSLGMWPVRDLKRVPVRGQPGQTRLKPNGETYFVGVHVNQWRGTSELKWLDDGVQPRMSVAQKRGEFGGHPLLDGKWLVVTPPGYGPAFLPAPIERVLKAWMKNENAQLQEIEGAIKGLQTTGAKPGKLSAGQDVLRTRLERATQWLASLSAEQRKAPAFVTRQGEVTTQAEPNSTQVWIDNPAYFDLKRPRTAPQLLVLDLSQLDMETPLGSQDQGAPRLLRQFVEGIDWRALSADMLKDAAP